MRRRRFLAVLGVSATGGCLRQAGESTDAGGQGSRASETTAAGPTETPATTSDSSSPESTTTAPSTRELEELWRIEPDVPLFEGYSPLVVGDDLAVFDSAGTATAVSLEDGTDVWTHPTGGRRVFAATRADGTVYVLGQGGTVTAIDVADGTVAWETSVDYAEGMSVVRGAPVDYFEGGSLVVGDGSVLAATHRRNEDATESQLARLDAGTGSQTWTTTHEEFEAEYDDAYTHGAVHGLAPPSDGTAVVSFTNELYGCDFSDGSIQWSNDHRMHNDNYGAMALSDGSILIPSYTLRAIDPATGEVRWRTDDDNAFGRLASGLTVADGAVFAGADDNGVYRFDAADGERAWRYQTGATVHCQPVYRDGTVWVGSDDGSLYGIDAEEGTSTSEQSVGAPLASVAVVDDTVVCVGDGVVAAYRM